MRINHNLTALNTYRQYNTNSVNTNKSMEKLSSGLRINRAADDAAGLSISEKMRSQIKGLTQGTRNAQDGVSFIQTAEGALTEVSDMLTRMKELATQVQNGTYSDDDQTNIGSEMKALGKAITDIYTDTEFNGKKVFGAAITISIVAMDDDALGAIDAAAAAAADPAATIYYGESGGQSLKIGQVATEALSALTEATSQVAGSGDPLDVTTDLVESAITEVNTQRANYGAWQNQLEHATNNMSATKENLQSAESRVRDVDMADEMMTYTKNNILLQAAQAMLAQANAQPQGVLQLLQ